MAARSPIRALTWCAGCEASHLATLFPVPGGWVFDCRIHGRVPYAASLPASEPIVIAPGVRRGRRTPARPPRPIGRPRKAA